MSGRRQRQPQTIKPAGGRARLVICLALAAAVLAIYWQAFGFELVDLDDDIYITNNPHVTSGLTWSNLKWAATALYHGTWQPVVWASFMVDTEVGRGSPWPFHLSNVLLHVANALLLFLLLEAVTNRRWESAAVAALFALHPLRVESVAWVAERKDVLSGLFWLLTTWAYVAYTKSPGLKRYALLICLFALGLAAKPVLITLPLVLMLLDWWPLGRLTGGGRAVVRLIVEKVPLFTLAAGSAVVTVVAQRTAGAVAEESFAPAGQRAACAAVNYVSYLGKTLWPRDLACLYPNPGSSLPVTAVVLSVALLVAISSLALVLHRRPWIAVGWFWFLIALAPTAGFVQFGMHGIADRFTYIPHIGLFAAVVYGVGQALAQRRRALAIVVLAVIAALGVRSYYQAGCWRDSRTLFSQAIQTTGRQSFLCAKLGCAMRDDGEIDQALDLLREAARSVPDNASVRYQLGVTLMGQRDLANALENLRAAVKREPGNALYQSGLGMCLSLLGRHSDAQPHFEQASRLDPASSVYRSNLGQCLALQGRTADAERELQEALRLDPGNATARSNLNRLRNAGTGNAR
jgi:Flp pilus assembly protein TadD